MTDCTTIPVVCIVAMLALNLYLLKAAVNIFILAMNQMTISYGKVVASTDEPTDR